jgi:hypothetical protein
LPWRDRALRWRHQFTAGAATLRHRTGRAVAGARHPGGARPAGSRRQPDRPHAGARGLLLQPAAQLQRRSTLLASQGGDAVRIPDQAQRADDRGRRPSRAVRAFGPGGGDPGHPVPLT